MRNEEKTENNDIEVTSDGIIVKVYYDLNKSNIIVHYVISAVDDDFTSFKEFGMDQDGNVIEPFAGLDLEDFIGNKENLSGCKPTEFNFISIYEVSDNVDYEVEFGKETRELTYVYQAPAGDVSPHTGIDDLEISNNGMFNLLGIITVISTGMYFLKREEN